MESVRLVHIPLSEVLPTDLLEVEWAMRHSHAGATSQDLLDSMSKDYSQLWLVSGLTTRVLVVTQILNHRAGSELKLQYIAGRGWFRHFGEILPLVEELARLAGCRFFGGQIRGKFAYKFYERLGAQVAGVYCFKDLKANERRTDDNGPTEAVEASPEWGGEYSGKSH